MKTEMSIPQKIWAVIKGNPIVIMMAVLSIAVGTTIPNFFSWNNLDNLLCNVTIRFLVALGVSGALIICGTDLSAGRQAALASTLTACLIQVNSNRVLSWLPEQNMWVALIIVVFVGALIGMVNGLVVAYLKVPPFIATLGSQNIVYGINLIYTNAQPISGQPQAFKDFWLARLPWFSDDFAGFHVYILIAVAAGIIFWFLYNKTTYGKYMYAIGGNENAAEVSGVNVRKIKVLIFVIAGVMYALAGYIMTGKTGTGNPGSGVSYELEAIAGCTIGGVSTTGGIGTVPGILVGVLVFELLKIILQFIGIDPNYNYIVQGLVIICAVAMDIRKYVAKK